VRFSFIIVLRRRVARIPNPRPSAHTVYALDVTILHCYGRGARSQLPSGPGRFAGAGVAPQSAPGSNGNMETVVNNTGGLMQCAGGGMRACRASNCDAAPGSSCCKRNLVACLLVSGGISLQAIVGPAPSSAAAQRPPNVLKSAPSVDNVPPKEVERGDRERGERPPALWLRSGRTQSKLACGQGWTTITNAYSASTRSMWELGFRSAAITCGAPKRTLAPWRAAT
jgi:hypothetical protein